ncbi:MAG: tyrosine-type recombinase/integrase [Candidatus Hydrogenedentes bacterium]|nr:tyrosine-type recombinase/integrase [Candidatus Hydrogenedentota bacterium]
MKKFPKPWFRPERGVWYVTLAGKQHNLGENKDEAFRAYHALMGKEPKALSSDSVLGILDRFLKWCHQNRKPRTYEWYQWRLQEFATHLKNAGLISLTVSGIKPFHLDDWLQPKSEWSSGTKHGMAKAVQRAFSWAAKRGHIDRSPIAHYEKARAGKRTEIVLPDDFTAILSHANPAEFRDLIETAWETGARPQEMTAIEGRHVDLKHGRWIFPPDESKGDIWPRIVYLNAKALEITRRLMKKHPTGPLFRNSKGAAWGPFSVNNAFRRLQLAMGRTKLQEPPQDARLARKLAMKEGKKYCLYTLRHSWADRALKSGLDALTVAILMGHRDPSMLTKVYQHLSQSPDYLAAAARKL